MANDVINLAYVIKPPKKPLNLRVQWVSGLENALMCWEGVHLERVQKFHATPSFLFDTFLNFFKAISWMSFFLPIQIVNWFI